MFLCHLDSSPNGRSPRSSSDPGVARHPTRALGCMGLRASTMANRTTDRPFTLYLDLLLGEREPAEDQLEDLWSALRRAVRAELQRRGLWRSPPRFLGYAGRETWLANDAEALRELLSDIYCFVFVDRLGALARQRRAKPNIDGLVFLNIRHFFHERMKHHDPVGYRIFEVVYGAVESAVERQALVLLPGPESQQGGTRTSAIARGSLAFPGVDTGADAPDPAPGLPAEVLESWLDELMPELVTAPGRGRKAVMDRLSDALTELERKGVGVFRFELLVRELEERVRRRWRTAFHEAQGESVREAASEDGPATWVRIVRPTPRYAEQQGFRHLVACVGRRVDAEAEGPPPKPGLRRLWSCLLAHAADADGAIRGKSAQRPPSRRQLARFLDLPRDRVAGYLEILGREVENCDAELSRSARRQGDRP